MIEILQQLFRHDKAFAITHDAMTAGCAVQGVKRRRYLFALITLRWCTFISFYIGVNPQHLTRMITQKVTRFSILKNRFGELIPFDQNFLKIKFDNVRSLTSIAVLRVSRMVGHVQ